LFIPKIIWDICTNENKEEKMNTVYTMMMSMMMWRNPQGLLFA